MICLRFDAAVDASVRELDALLAAVVGGGSCDIILSVSH